MLNTGPDYKPAPANNMLEAPKTYAFTEFDYLSDSEIQDAFENISFNFVTEIKQRQMTFRGREKITALEIKDQNCHFVARLYMDYEERWYVEPTAKDSVIEEIDQPSLDRLLEVYAQQKEPFEPVAHKLKSAPRYRSRMLVAFMSDFNNRFEEVTL